MAKPWTSETLQEDLRKRFRLCLPDKTFTPGHSTPLDFVLEAITHPGRDLAVWANRGGLKTLSASLIAAIELSGAEEGPAIHAMVLSGSEEQARNLYGYWMQWCEGPLAQRVKGLPRRGRTCLKGGCLEVLSSSQKRVRGPKIQRLFRDEVDEIDPEVFGASVGMLAARNGVPARTIDISTWHRADGPMAGLVTRADEAGIRLHRWNIWETIARCPPDRHEDGRGCRNCPLREPCVAKAQECRGQPKRELGIAAEARGMLTIDDAIRQYRQWSLPQWQTEAECIRPSVEGLVYPTFDRRTHVRADLDSDANLPTCRSVDWGWREFVCLWIQDDRAGNVRVVDEYASAGRTVADNAEQILRHDKGRPIEATYCDPAGHSANDQTGQTNMDVFAACGIPCSYAGTPWAREVRNGLNLVRAFLTPACGPPRLILGGRCRRLIRAFETYRNRRVNGQYIDKPEDPQDAEHAMDALRYYFVNRWPPFRSETRLLSYV